MAPSAAIAVPGMSPERAERCMSDVAVAMPIGGMNCAKDVRPPARCSET